MNTSQPQMLMAVENLAGGGAERVALDIARHWPCEDYRPVILLAQRSGTYLADVPDDIEILEVGVTSSPRQIPLFLRRLGAVTRGRPIAGVISHLTGMNRMMMRARLAGVIRAPVAVVEHNNFHHVLSVKSPAKGRLLMWETSFLFRRADAVVGCGRGVADQLGKLFPVGPERLHAIPNPLSSRFLRPAPLDARYVEWISGLKRPITISVGRMDPKKDFASLLRAFAQGGRGSLIILGEGPERPELETLARSLGIAERVVMPGFVDRPEQLLQVCDLYVSSSMSEGYPLTLIEAYASGLPVVARDCDFGPREIVTSDRPGALVKATTVDALADAIAHTLATTSRFAPGTLVDLTENLPDTVARRYRALFP